MKRATPGRAGRGARLRRRARGRRARARGRERAPRAPARRRARQPPEDRGARAALRVARSRSRTSSSSPRRAPSRSSAWSSRPTSPARWRRSRTRSPSCPQDEVKVNIIHRGVGGINESDVMLAAASDGVILAFNVRPVGDARQIAEREGVEIRSYAVIYRAIEELRAAMQGMLEPEEVETPLGQAEVRQLFRASRIGTIAGSLRHRGQGHARRARARRARGHGHLRHDDRQPAPLQRGRARGRQRASSAGSCSPTSRICARATCSRPTRRARSSASCPPERRARARPQPGDPCAAELGWRVG